MKEIIIKKEKDDHGDWELHCRNEEGWSASSYAHGSSQFRTKNDLIKEKDRILDVLAYFGETVENGKVIVEIR